jgi:chromosome segregation ATPase
VRRTLPSETRSAASTSSRRATPGVRRTGKEGAPTSSPSPSLQKKNQELEKFKFVLDYKIKELKRDIAPREMEITRLKQETNDMDKNLKHFNKINANLGYIVDDLRTRQEQMQELIKKNRSKIRANDIFIKGFTNAVYRTV